MNSSDIKIQGINHITFAVADLKKSIEFYKILFGNRLVAESEQLAYFDLQGVWFALNLESKEKTGDHYRSYSHVAFSMSEEDQAKLKDKLDKYKISYEDGRPRDPREGQSFYIRDYDGHLIEFHSHNLQDRLKYYDKERQDVKVYN